MMTRFVQKLVAASALALLLASAASANGPQGLDPDSWIAEIETAFADVKGYSAVIVHEDGYVLSRSGGMANPGQGMTWDHYGNIGSVNKMVTTLLLLRKMEDKKGRGLLNSINVELNRPVYQFMPEVIQQATPEINKQITFQDLLRHKSGLRTEHASGNPFVDFLQPIDAENYGVRSYSNTNFKLLGYLIVGYGAPNILAETNTWIAQQDLSATDFEIAQHLGYYYEGMVRVQLLDKAPLEVDSSCWLDVVIDFMNADVAWMYWTKNDSLTSGGWYDSGAIVGHCKGQGGWYYSTHALARLFRDLGTPDGVISAPLYEKMFDVDGSSATRNNRLGWSNQISSVKLESEFGWVASPYHGGDHTIVFNNHYVTGRAAVIRLPGGYHSVALINSNEMNSGDIASALKNAFARSIP